jgi:hypothetical protein
MVGESFYSPNSLFFCDGVNCFVMNKEVGFVFYKITDLISLERKMGPKYIRDTLYQMKKRVTR